MIDQASVDAVDASRWRSRFVKPLYHSYCFAQIPRLVEELLGDGGGDVARLLVGSLAQRYDRVILLFIDGFGWRFLQEYGEWYQFLQRIRREGLVTKVTSQFPSSTAPHTTAIHTGLEVGQSGVYEWFYYEPLLDTLIAPLLFSFAGDTERGTLERAGISPEQLFPRTTVYERLGRQGVVSHVFQSQAFTPAPFSNTVTTGAQLHPFPHLAGGLAALREMLLTNPARAYYYLYFGEIDTAGHVHGVNSPQFVEQVDLCFSLLESILHAGLRGKIRNTLLLITADHGQTEVNPATTIYLNQTLPEVRTWIATNRQGQPLVPAGSCRDMFLHIREEYVEQAESYLRHHLAGRAEVCRVSDLIEQGFFGSLPPSDTFLRRVGNLVILPYEHESVWWYEKGRHVQNFYGHHGGLTGAEMETVLLTLPYA